MGTIYVLGESTQSIGCNVTAPICPDVLHKMGKNTAGIKDENQMLMPLSLMTIHKVKSLYAYLKEKTGETEGRSFVMAGLIVLGIVQIYTL
jgi:hypothetical protein